MTRPDAAPGTTPDAPARPLSATRAPAPSAGTSDPAVRAALRAAERDPAGLGDAACTALLLADGRDLEALCALADGVRRDAVGDELTFVVNRNLDTAVVLEEDAPQLLAEAVALGATEVCVQGPLPEDAPADGYLRLVRLVAEHARGVHLHAFRPAEVADAAARLGTSPREFLLAARAAGLGSVCGTAAKVLDDDVRTRLNGGVPDLPVARWLELVATAHAAGLRSTATVVHGHVETPAQQVAHLRLLADLQDRTGGFTEFIPMPFLPPAGPLPPGCRPGPDAREVRALTAVARLLLHGRIDHVQTAWTKVRPDVVEQLLRGGADDLGGLLVDGALRPGAGAEAGRELTRADVAALGERLGRRVRQRTTLYGDVPAAPGGRW
ncbi:FO synthase [Kineococcus terrestris]|uniref:FO synthase n=1 Tax=Kineococcus terrestris TaxID=2044856 RepID=UPI0034DB70AF